MLPDVGLEGAVPTVAGSGGGLPSTDPAETACGSQLEGVKIIQVRIETGGMVVERTKQSAQSKVPD